MHTLFRLDARDQKRPRIAFYSFEKWPKGRRTPNSDPFKVVPDLAVEVVSPSVLAADMMMKVRDYFQAKVRAVWLVYPDLDMIHVYESFTRINVLTRADELDGGAILPGFRLALADLFFGEPADEDETPDPSP